MCRMIGAVAVPFVLAIAAVPAAADDRTDCERASGDSAIEACTRAIGSGQQRARQRLMALPLPPPLRNEQAPPNQR